MHSNVCSKYRKSKKDITKILSLSIVYSDCCHEYHKIFKEVELIKILKILDLIDNIENIMEYLIMPIENIKGSQEFRLKIIAKIINYLFTEINQNELMSKKHKKFVEFSIILNNYVL